MTFESVSVSESFSFFIAEKSFVCLCLQIYHIRFTVARRLARISHPQVAKRILQDSLRRAPKNGYLWHGLAQCSKDDTSLAREYYKKGCQYGCVNSL